VRRLLAALAVAVALAIGAFVIVTRGSPSNNPATIPPSPVDGVVVRVDSSGLNAVRSFTLRTTDGTQLKFDLSQLQNGTEFPPGHLTEHAATAQAIRVDFRPGDGGVLFATRLEDAPTSP
jgi:hypothetical protein